MLVSTPDGPLQMLSRMVKPVQHVSATKPAFSLNCENAAMSQGINACYCCPSADTRVRDKVLLCMLKECARAPCLLLVDQQLTLSDDIGVGGRSQARAAQGYGEACL